MLGSCYLYCSLLCVCRIELNVLNYSPGYEVIVLTGVPEEGRLAVSWWALLLAALGTNVALLLAGISPIGCLRYKCCSPTGWCCSPIGCLRYKCFSPNAAFLLAVELRCQRC